MPKISNKLVVLNIPGGAKLTHLFNFFSSQDCQSPKLIFFFQNYKRGKIEKETATQ